MLRIDLSHFQVTFLTRERPGGALVPGGRSRAEAQCFVCIVVMHSMLAARFLSQLSPNPSGGRDFSVFGWRLLPRSHERGSVEAIRPKGRASLCRFPSTLTRAWLR